MHNDTDTPIQDVDDESYNYVPAIASVVAILTIPEIYIRVMRKRRARRLKQDKEYLAAVAVNLNERMVTKQNTSEV